MTAKYAERKCHFIGQSIATFRDALLRSSKGLIDSPPYSSSETNEKRLQSIDGFQRKLEYETTEFTIVIYHTADRILQTARSVRLRFNDGVVFLSLGRRNH